MAVGPEEIAAGVFRLNPRQQSNPWTHAFRPRSRESFPPFNFSRNTGVARPISDYWKRELTFRLDILGRPLEKLEEDYLLWALMHPPDSAGPDLRRWARDNFVPNPDKSFWGIDRAWPNALIHECLKMVR